MDENRANVKPGRSKRFSDLVAISVESGTYVQVRFAPGVEKNQRRQAVILYTVAPALRSGRGLKQNTMC